MKKKIEKIATVISLIILLWISASFIEVNCKNLKENPAYCPINFFVLIGKTG